jgi:hypothetical protein
LRRTKRDAWRGSPRSFTSQKALVQDDKLIVPSIIAGNSSLNEPAQKSSDSEIVDGGADESTEKWAEHRNPPNASAVGQTVIFESGDCGEKTWAEIAGGIDGVSVHASEAHTDGDDDQADHEAARDWRREEH